MRFAEVSQLPAGLDGQETPEKERLMFYELTQSQFLPLQTRFLSR